MKKSIYFIFSLFLFIPFVANAETLTYNVCESGCEYTNLDDIETAINNISDLSDKDIVINVNSDMDSYLHIGGINNIANSVTINGNNRIFNENDLYLYSKKIEINDCNKLKWVRLNISEKIHIKNSNISFIGCFLNNLNNQVNIEEINLSDVLDIDETTKSNLKTLALIGNIKIENMDFSNLILANAGGTTNIYNSKLNKILNAPEIASVTVNIYNSKFNSLKYVNITSSEDAAFNEFAQFMGFDSPNSSLLNYDIYDLDGTGFGMQTKSTTTVYFDKEAKLKPEDKLNLADYLDYYTNDKEIEYTIEEEGIAKIENKELIGLKEGNTKVTVTTDDGHVIYRINLVVEKETIPEKIDKMTIKVPITGSKVKAWALIVGGILLGIVLICVYMLIKRKK